MKKFLKSGLGIGIIILVSLALIVGVVLIFSKASVPAVKSNGKPTPTPTASSTPGSTSTPTPTASNAVYNDLDAAAIIGALALARQTPVKAGKPLTDFVTNLALAKIDSTKSKLDIAVKGNQLITYSVGSNGAAGPICFVVKPPVVAKGTPGQSQWVVYFEPKNGSKSELLLIKIGITTCGQAKTIADNSKNSERVKLSADSHAIAKDAALKVPASVLTPLGLIMLDEARGLLNPTPVTSPTK